MGGASDSAHGWRCTDCGQSAETNEEPCQACDNEAFARIANRTLVYERHAGVDDEQPRVRRHLNKEAITSFVIDAPIVRRDVAVVVSLASLALILTVAEFVNSDVAVALAFALGIGYLALLYFRRPPEGVSVRALEDQVSLGGNPEPYLRTVLQEADVLLKYASSWRTPLYIVDREHWFVPARLDSLLHRTETPDKHRYFAVGGGLVAGIAAGVVANFVAETFVSVGAGVGVAVVVAVALWLYLRDPLDDLLFRTDGGVETPFKLPGETATDAVEGYESAITDLGDSTLTIDHGPGITEYISHSKLVAATRRNHEWTTLAKALGALGVAAVGAFVWDLTRFVGIATVWRGGAAVAGAGVAALALVLWARRPEAGFVESVGVSRAVPEREIEWVFTTVTEEFDELLTVEGRIETPFQRRSTRTLVVPGQVGLVDHYTGAWYRLRWAKFVAAGAVGTAVGTLAAWVAVDGGLWTRVLAAGGIVTLGLVAVLLTREEQAAVDLHLRDGTRRRYWLNPDEAATLVDTFTSSQPTVSRTVEGRYWTQYRYANLERVAVVTPSRPSMGTLRKALVLLPTVVAIGGAIYLHAEFAVGTIPLVAIGLGGLVASFFTLGWLSYEKGAQVVTGAGRLVSSELDADEVLDDLETERNEVLAVEAGDRDLDTWHLVPQEVAVLEKWQPPSDWRFFVVGIGGLLVAVLAGAGILELVGTSTAGYALAVVAGICGGYLALAVLTIVFEALGIPLLDRMRADIVGPELMETSVSTADPGFETFDSRDGRPGGDPTVYDTRQPAPIAPSSVHRLGNVLFPLISFFDSDYDSRGALRTADTGRAGGRNRPQGRDSQATTGSGTAGQHDASERPEPRQRGGPESGPGDGQTRSRGDTQPPGDTDSGWTRSEGEWTSGTERSETGPRQQRERSETGPRQRRERSGSTDRPDRPERDGPNSPPPDGRPTHREREAGPGTHPEPSNGDGSQRQRGHPPGASPDGRQGEHSDASPSDRRFDRPSEPAPSDGWYKLVYAGILLSLVGIVVLPLYFVGWVLTPLALFVDARRMNRLAGMVGWWIYPILALLPFVAILVAAVYLARRPNTVPPQ